MRFSDVGTLAWARRTAGRIGRRDRLELLRQGMIVRWRRRAARREIPPVLAVEADSVRLPDTPALRLAMQELEDTSPPHLVNHGYRCYWWAALLARAHGLTPDSELLGVACLLHDIGLTPAGHMGSACFAVDGARYAEGYGGRAGWAKSRTARLAEALSLHINVLVPPRQGVEAHLLNAATALDVTGLNADRLAASLRQTVVDRYPRRGFKAAITADLERQVALRPCCRMHYLVGKLGFTRLVARAPFAE